MLSTGKCEIEDINIYVYGVLMIFNEYNFEADFPVHIRSTSHNCTSYFND